MQREHSMEFQCQNGQHISQLSLCDGLADCEDETDEIPSQCYESGLRCPPSLFRCSYGACVPKSAVCNGVKDCNDNSDEDLTECTCADSEFRCSNGNCVPESAICNGIEDCPDNSDETLAECYESSNKCLEDEFQCTIGQCISKSNLCDGHPDCGDSSDETVFACSNVLCSPFSFRCTYGACVSKDLVCNGEQNCLDNSDESETLCTKPYKKMEEFCPYPPQPENGLWRMHRSQCGFRYDEHCNVSVGVVFNRRARLVYSCNHGFLLEGPTEVVCNPYGEWTEMPRCIGKFRLEFLGNHYFD